MRPAQRKFKYRGFVTTFNTILEREWVVETIAETRDQAVKKLQQLYKNAHKVEGSVMIDGHTLKEIWI